jgi:hypothetical protein
MAIWGENDKNGSPSGYVFHFFMHFLLPNTEKGVPLWTSLRVKNSTRQMTRT